MKIFKLDDGSTLQLADKESMEKWDAEMPLIFIGAMKEKRLPLYRKSYSKETIKAVEEYVEDILESVAIPKLINALTSDDETIRLTISENILKLSEGNPDQLKIALPHIQKAESDSNKDVVKNMKAASKNYNKAQKRKQTAAKRKKLTKLRKNMDEVDIKFADGKISDAEYIKEQKIYLKLKREIELAESVD